MHARLARQYVDKYRVKTTQERGRAGSRRRCGLFKGGNYRAVTGVAREYEAVLVTVGVGFFLCQSHMYGSFVAAARSTTSYEGYLGNRLVACGGLPWLPLNIQ